jgi:hypothetical protein
MKTLVIVAVCVAVLGLAGVSLAAEISSPGMFGVVFQYWAECVVFNGGKTPLAVTVKIVSHGGGPLETYGCDGPVGPGQFCAVGAGWSDGLALDDGFPVSCSATAPSVANLRGAFVIHERVNDGFGGLRLLPMRSAPLR